MTAHPLHSLATLSTRQRIRAALGPCVGFDPELHVDRITERVLQVRIPQLELIEHLQARAAALAREDGTQRLMTEGSIS